MKISIRRLRWIFLALYVAVIATLLEKSRRSLGSDSPFYDFYLFGIMNR